MKLKYQQDYLSITKFNDIELANFTVLTGVNGSGKSHLLQAIEQKKVIIEGYENSNIVLFNYETFKLENESSFNAQTISQEREQAWNFFIQNNGGNIKNSIQSWKNNLGVNYQTILTLCKEKKKNLFSLTKKDISNDAIFDQLKSYRQNIKNHFRNNNNLKDNQQAHAILVLIKKLPYSIDEIEKNDFLKLYKPFYFKNDFLPQQLGKIIWDYHIRLRTYQINEFENEKHGKNYPVLTEAEFTKLYGDKPWKVINEILSNFDSLKYKINSPEETDYYSSYQLKLIHTQKENVNPNFSELSSGERILMALVASIYKSSSDNHFPNILLLDEIDASLHPSMMRNLLAVINNIFLKKGVKVILVTHSPSTIALAEEESIFVMNESGDNRIEKKTKENALEILTEGFASLSHEESNLGISYNISKSNLPILFTEGITDKIILETAWRKLNPSKDMPFYIQDSFDASFLGSLFKRGDNEQEGIFEVYPDKKFFALFDFDSAGYSQWNNLSKFTEYIEENPKKCLTKKHIDKNAYALLLPVPESDIKNQVINGETTFKDKSLLDIELLFYGVDSLNYFFKKETHAGGGEIIKFSGKKRKFAEQINNLSSDDFKNFESLFEKIENLINI